ncbi:MAG: hypothetical protein HGA53_09790 [Anaerolineaceae bacterium]|nr:hypothetical protein [Anaerolineaceae bacterium]
MATKVIERSWGMEQKSEKKLAAASDRQVETFWTKIQKFFWRPSRLSNEEAVLRMELRGQAALQKTRPGLDADASRILRKII